MKKTYFKLLVSMLIFGTNGIIAHFIHLGSLPLILWRLIIGTVTLALVFFVTKKETTVKKYPKDALFICASGVFMGFNWVILFETYRQIGVSLGSLLNYSAPVFVLVFAPLFFGEKLTKVRIAGFLIVVTGIVLVNGIDGSKANTFGVILGILSAVTYAMLIIINKKAEQIRGIENTLIQMVSALITVFIFALIKGEVKLPSDTVSVLLLVVFGVVNTALACLLYFSVIGELPAASVSVCSYLDPLFSVILSALILSEKMTVIQIIGGVLILGGALWSELSSLKQMTNKKQTDK